MLLVTSLLQFTWTDELVLFTDSRPSWPSFTSDWPAFPVLPNTRLFVCSHLMALPAGHLFAENERECFEFVSLITSRNPYEARFDNFVLSIILRCFVIVDSRVL